MQTQQEIPERLRAPVNAALAWVNAQEQAAFELTGLVDTEAALQADTDQPFELGLVLCDGELCDRQQIRFTPSEAGFEFSYVQAAERDIPPLLDPPVGVRTNWLDSVLEKHEFVLLLFYRGLW